MKSELSPRELSVLSYAVQGFTDDMIAHELGIECGTVNNYWVRIRAKLGNLSRTELVARFVQKKADGQHADHVAQLEAAAVTRQSEHKIILDKANAEIKRLKQLLDNAKN